MGEAREFKHDLLRFGAIKRILKSRGFHFAIILINLSIFILVILTGLFGTPVGSVNFSVVFVWIVWWFVLIAVLVPFASRLWCSMCPIPAPGEWLQRRAFVRKREGKPFGLNRRWPSKLRNIWLCNFGFLGIAIFSGIITASPIVTGVLLLGLIIAAMILAVIFEKRAFCRYACPVGGFLGLYSSCATLEVRAKDQEVCKEHLHEYQTACQAACPAGIRVQEYAASIAQGRHEDAINVLKEQMPFSGVCGRICHHPCETECVRKEVDQPVAIMDLKRFAADYEMKNGSEKATPVKKTKKDKVAIIGSGPAGLACAYDLVRKGYPVTVFEAAPKAGGLMRYGVPEFRLPKEILDHEIGYIQDLGVGIKTNTPLGEKLTIKKLKEQGNKAIFLATGAWLNRKTELKGLEYDGVLWGLDFLREINSGRKVKIGDRVLVVGGGNVAMDAALTSLRLGAKQVNILYRRSREEIPAFPEEVKQGEEEGVNFHFLVGPTELLGEGGRVTAVECIKMKLGEPDETGRRRPIPIEGSEYTMKADTVIIAIGQSTDLSILPKEIKTKQNAIAVDEVTLETSLPGVFAGGDVVTGPANVIAALAMGKEAAISIDRYLQGVDLKEGRPLKIEKVGWKPKEGEAAKKKRAVMPTLELRKRANSFGEVKLGFDEKIATEEALRCFTCGCDTKRGNEKGYGCPWFQYPMSMERNNFCGMCFECLRTCPKDNIAINVRPFAKDVTVEHERGLDEAWKAFIMLTLVFLYSAVMMGPWGFLKDWARISTLGGYAMYLTIFLGATLLLTPAIFFAFTWLSKRLSGLKEVSLKKLFVGHSYALIPMGLAGWIAFSLPIILVNWSRAFPVISDPFGWGWNLLGTRDFAWNPSLAGIVPYLQIIVVLIGLYFSIKVGYKISKQIFVEDKRALRGMVPLVVFLSGAALLMLWFFTGG